MNYISRHLPDILAGCVGLALQLHLYWWMMRRPAIQQNRTWSRLVTAATIVGCLLLIAGQVTRPMRVALRMNPVLREWISTGSLSLVLLLVLVTGITMLLGIMPRPAMEHSPSRRGFLLATRGAVLSAPLAATGYAVFIQRSKFTAREISLPIAGLAPELDGLKLVQLSDIHLSPFLNEREFARAVDMANEFQAHLGLVTGDLITSARDPLDQCIRQLARLRTEAGTLGCMGNHEIYAGAEDEAERQAARVGIEFLRSKSKILRFRGKPVNFAGVDYQMMHSRYLVGAEKLMRPDMPNILLSHNPDVFPVAARMGYDATISGHTHGGQISVEILHQSLNVARFYTPFVYGLYRKGKSSIYVTRGIGTVGVPARLGAPPEIALIRLCAI